MPTMAIPRRLGRLERVGLLGTGGFATVWHYRDDDLSSDVAVKVLADNWAQQHDMRERFLEEARILRRCDSDHVVRVYDIGEHEDTPYFVMTYADLGSLAGLVGEPNPPDVVVDLVTQAACGIGVLHERGVLHRDIKPQNLLLRSNGTAPPRLLVADLGVAKAMLQASGLTQLVGTPAYMAPEQADGLPLDVRTDVYSLGAVAYVLLTGQTVRGSGLSLAAGLPPAPSSLVPLPPEYDDVVLTALAPDPEDRYADVAEFAAALQTPARTRRPAGSVAAGVPVGRASGPGAGQRRAGWPLVVGAAMVTLIVSFLLAYFLVSAIAG